jgi:metal-dependent amidase/aminoacylase/carboxypeptidase family protein
VDTIVIAAQIITALQTLVSRNVSPLDSAVLSLGKIEGGTARNIICDNVRIEGTLRTLRPETRAMMKEKIMMLPKSIAEAMGGSAEVSAEDGYGAVYNDEALHERFLTIARELVGEGRIVTRQYPSLGVESFGFFLEKTPGIYYDLGCGVGPALHTSNFHVDESCLPFGAALQASMVLDLLKG